MPTHPTRATPLDAFTLKELWEGSTGLRVVDVRTPAEFEAVHIPGAHNIPLNQIGHRRDDLVAQLDDDTVLVCRSGARAREAHTVLSAQGMTGVRVLEGGMMAWESAGAPVTRGRQTWDMERQVRFAAGSMVLSGILLSEVFPRVKWFSGAIGTGLVFAAVSNTCAMGNALARMPWNRATDTPGLEDMVAESRVDP